MRGVIALIVLSGLTVGVLAWTHGKVVQGNSGNLLTNPANGNLLTNPANGNLVQRP